MQIAAVATLNVLILFKKIKFMTPVTTWNSHSLDSRLQLPEVCRCLNAKGVAVHVFTCRDKLHNLDVSEYS